jgi:hypothetical protein
MTSAGTKKSSRSVCSYLSPNHLIPNSTGVTFCLVTDGTTSALVDKGLAEWRKRHPVEVAEDAE